MAGQYQLGQFLGNCFATRDCQDSDPEPIEAEAPSPVENGLTYVGNVSWGLNVLPAILLPHLHNLT